MSISFRATSFIAFFLSPFLLHALSNKFAAFLQGTDDREVDKGF